MLTEQVGFGCSLEKNLSCQENNLEMFSTFALKENDEDLLKTEAGSL